ncbi:hypothetical protein PA598K_02516 [Paenibacillus sp. 598K]|uniref:GerAB/ArcD/ProY family transporter n=1 Tax=Paenibacillus sp. 598K TaxID=1117987 RepID=UPI000FF97C59|nr:endospore germination permease [Paenibacillus sp. 598K]GBF74184.1 hypothetical protein PA598K_02516 [Paenibacillus sp. 598K]
MPRKDQNQPNPPSGEDQAGDKKAKGGAADDAQTSEGSVISERQSASIIASSIIGVGVITLPRVTVTSSNQTGWIGIISGVLVAMGMTWIITRLGIRFRGQSIALYAAELLAPTRRLLWLGKALALPFLLILLVFWGWGSALVARLFGEMVSTTMLPTTPVEVIILTMLAAGFYLTMYSVEVLARVNEILLPLIVVPILIIAISSFQSGRLENLFPIFDMDWKMFFVSTAVMTSSLLGYEVMMLFSAHTKISPKLTKTNVLSISIPGLLYALIAIAGISVFGYEELKLLAWPTLELVKTTEVPGLILERMESAFLAVWVTAVFTTVGNYYYATALLLKQILHLKEHRLISLLLLPVMYWISLRPNNLHQLFQTQDRIAWIGVTGALGLPLFFGLLSKLRGKAQLGSTATRDARKGEGQEE